MERLRKRAAFKAVAGGRRLNRKGFLLQARTRPTGRDDGPRHTGPRFGFTVTRKTGNAVVRNRIRRRLREAVRLVGPAHASDGTDYVLIGRRSALTEPFETLLIELTSGLDRLSDTDGRRSRATPVRND